MEKEEGLSGSFYEAIINLINNPQKDIMGRKNYRPISLVNIDSNTVKISAN